MLNQHQDKWQTISISICCPVLQLMMKQESRYNTYISSNATNQKKMGEIFCQRVGTPSTSSRRQSKIHQHNFYPGTQQKSNRKNKRRRIWSFFCNYIPYKYEPHWTILVAGGNLTSFPGCFSTITEDITTAKLLLNSNISTKGARFPFCDIKNFYLGTLMNICEYIRLSINLPPK